MSKALLCLGLPTNHLVELHLLLNTLRQSKSDKMPSKPTLSTNHDILVTGRPPLSRPGHPCKTLSLLTQAKANQGIHPRGHDSLESPDTHLSASSIHAKTIIYALPQLLPKCFRTTSPTSHSSRVRPLLSASSDLSLSRWPHSSCSPSSILDRYRGVHRPLFQRHHRA